MKGQSETGVVPVQWLDADRSAGEKCLAEPAAAAHSSKHAPQHAARGSRRGPTRVAGTAPKCQKPVGGDRRER